MALEHIRAFYLLSDGTATSGMPRPEHFPEIAAAGFCTVINLALPTSDNALPNEADLVTRAGMTYVHIPVLFDAPKRSDYDKFEKILNAVRDQPVFVHCAANMRVSAFMYSIASVPESSPATSPKRTFVKSGIPTPRGPSLSPQF